MMRVGYYQFCPEFGDVAGNLAQVEQALDGADADLIVLPELAFTGYLFEDREELDSLAEMSLDSRTVSALTDLCRRNDFHLVTGFAERCDGKLYNSALVVGPNGLEHTYRKLHLFSAEKECFDPGDKPPAVVTIRGVRIGVMICFDWIFPETARSLALQGADVICHPANLVLTYCQDAMVTRCLENGLFAITANRTGKDTRPHGEITFTGQSQVMSPKGERLASSSADEEVLVIHEVDPATARTKTIAGNNDLIDDRRPELYRLD